MNKIIPFLYIFVSIIITIVSLTTIFVTVLNPAALDIFPTFICILSAMVSIFFLFSIYILDKLRSFNIFSTSFSKKLLAYTAIFGLVVFGVSICISSLANHKKLSPNSTKLIILGLDGANLDLMKPWMEQGKLNHIKSLVDNAAHADLQSLEIMRSPTLWTTICTGLPPKAHGIDGFFATRRDLTEPRVWDIAKQNNHKVGLFAWLVTEAYMDKFEFVIPGWLARTPETTPPLYNPVQEIRFEQGTHTDSYCPLKSIFNSISCGIRLSTMQELLWFYFQDYWGLTEEERLAKKQLTEVGMHTDAFLHALRTQQPDLATFTLYGSDKLAHRFWHYLRPQDFGTVDPPPSPFLQNALFNYYQKADQAIGRILKILPPDCTVMLISDHGMKADTALPRRFFLNTPALLKAVGMESAVHYVNLPGETQLLPRRNEPKEIQTLIERINAITWPDDNVPLFRLTTNQDGSISIRQNFSMSYYEESPILSHSEIPVGDQTITTRKLFHLRTFSANHERDGIFVMRGPHVKTGRLPQTPTLYDLAPTMLYLLDLPISQELPGNIIKEAIDPNYFENNPPNYIDAYPPLKTEAEEPEPPMNALYERLQSVGYVD